MRECLECGKPLTGQQRKFCGKTHTNRYSRRDLYHRNKNGEKVIKEPRTLLYYWARWKKADKIFQSAISSSSKYWPLN